MTVSRPAHATITEYPTQYIQEQNAVPSQEMLYHEKPFVEFGTCYETSPHTWSPSY